MAPRGRPPKHPKVEKRSKAPPKKRVSPPSLAQGSATEKDLVLLWICFETSDGIKAGQTTIDYHALGEKLGLTYTQAKTRYYSLRSRIQKLMESTPKVEDQGSHDPETESGLQTEPGESTPAEEENLTTMETSPGEQAEGELADAEDEAEDI